MKKSLLLLLIGWMTVVLVLTPLAVAPAAVLATASGPALSRQELDVKKLPADLALASSADEKIKPLKKPAPQPPPDAANKWALVIGIADYSGRENDLWHPDEDASEMASYLVSRGFATDRIKILLNRKATAAAILAAIDWLKANENSQSTVVFFYSGHGFRAADVDGWDADAEADGFDEGIVSYDLYGLPDGLLRQSLAGLEAQKVALLFGSCHSGGMFDDNDDLQANGRIIASACQADQYGWDYLTLGNTLWAKYFVDLGLLNGQADSIEAAHAFAYPLVVAQQPQSQPQLSDGYAGDFVP
ncbi:MAG: caspase family protein [Clostridiaceae bacterium]|nr:caspase family protein [Clostridiaceae bacterium]